MSKGRILAAVLTLSSAGLGYIAGREGFEPVAKPPVPGDVPTVGYGHTGPEVKLGDTITPERALVVLKQDARKHERAVQRCVTVPLYQHEYDAFTSLAFNIGENAFCKSTLVRKLNAGDYAGACAQILRWNKFKGRELRGLTTRRQAEYRQCLGETT